MASLVKAKRDQLLGKIRGGHDLEAACAALDITEAQIEAGGDKLKADIAAAFKTGTSRLRGKIMEGALSSDNVTVLMKLLEQRQASQEAELAKAGEQTLDRQDFGKRLAFLLTKELDDPETRDEVMARVLRATCVHCGRPPYTPEPPQPPHRRVPAAIEVKRRQEKPMKAEPKKDEGRKEQPLILGGVMVFPQPVAWRADEVPDSEGKAACT